MGTTSINETRPGLPLPPREAEAIGKLVLLRGVGLGNVDGETNSIAVVRFFRGWPEANMVHGLVVPPFIDGRQRLVHGWATETSESDNPPLHGRTGVSILHRYSDGEVRVIPGTAEGVRPDQLANVHHAIRDFADLAATEPTPEYTDEAAYRVADLLPDDVLRGAAKWMLDDAAANAAPRQIAA